MNEDGKKQEWVSAKIAKLVEEGKPQEQAVAIANSMWEEENKKKGNMDSVEHIDFVDMADFTSKMEETDEGFLVGRAIVTNVGVFTYMNADGTTRRELRLPEEVFAEDSLSSYVGKPVTDDHPREFVDKDNVRQLEVGTVMSPIMHDDYRVSAGIVIRDKDAISKIKMGKAALSCGYKLNLDWQSGVWMGVPYDCIQRNIAINHVAVVDRGRAGDAARLRMDSQSNISVQVKEDSMADKAMRTINLDNVEYQAEDAVIDAYKGACERADSLQVKVDSLTAEKSAVEAEKDSLKEKNDSLSKELTELKAKSVDSAEVEKMVKARLALIASAGRAKVQVTDEMDEKAIKVAVVKAVFPKANLDGRDDVYVQARFDLAIESMDEMEENDSAAAVRELNSDAAKKTNTDKADEARKRMIAQYGKARG